MHDDGATLHLSVISTMSTPAFTIHTSFSPLISLYDSFLLDQFGGEWYLFAMMYTSCALLYFVIVTYCYEYARTTLLVLYHIIY